MTDHITVEQADQKLDQICMEWVNRDLEKGIPLPFRYWRGGRYKEILSFVLWQNVIVPLIFTIIVFTCALNGEWKVFWILFPCYMLYWVIGILIRRRENANFILKADGLTIVTPRDRTYIPWESVRSITSNDSEVIQGQSQNGYHRKKRAYGNGYNLVIQAGNTLYSFYEVYAKRLVTDADGRINPAMMQLHIAYRMLEAAHEKMKNS